MHSDVLLAQRRIVGFEVCDTFRVLPELAAGRDTYSCMTTCLRSAGTVVNKV